MAFTIIERAHRVTIVEHFHQFDSLTHPGSGYSFPCNEDGTLLDPEHAAMLAERHADETHKYRGVRKSTSSYWQSAFGRCSCGHEMHLSNSLDNDCRCKRCYNGGGQEVIPSRLCDSRGEPYDYDD